MTLSAIVAPVANDDTTNNLPTNAIASIPVLDNDTLGTLPLDPDSLLIEGMASFTVDGEGTWSQGTGAITFQPVAGFTANPTAVRYTVSDVAGTPSNTATITLTFTPRPPVAHDDIRTDRTTAQPVTVNVLANDQDPDGTLDPTSLRVENAPGDGTALSVEGEGTWTTTAEGTIIFTPAPGFTADPTPIAYTVADNDNNRSTAASVVLTFTARPLSRWPIRSPTSRPTLQRLSPF